MKGEPKPIESLRSAIAFDPRDWSVDSTDAWIYGVIVGWDDAISVLASQHRWTAETVERLRILHSQFTELRDRRGP